MQSDVFNIKAEKIRIHKVFETASVVLNATLSIFAMIHVLTTIILKRATTKNHVAKHFFCMKIHIPLS